VPISVVLRLSSAALAEGRLAGEAVLAETGERTVVASAEELIGFVAAHQPVSAEVVGRPGMAGQTVPRGWRDVHG